MAVMIGCGVRNVRLTRDNSRVEKHDAERSVDGTEVKCDQCGKAFASKGSLWRHVAYIHKHGTAESKAVTCEQCGEVFRSPMKYRQHVIQKVRPCSERKYLVL